jgi:Uma2 family endonuclease
MTPEEFDAIEDYDERYRYELIRGVLVVSPYPGKAEVSPNQYLGYLLLQYQENDPRGPVLDETLPEQTIPTTNRRRADRAIWVGLGRAPVNDEDVPAIVVEFVSPRKRDIRRDYEEKRSEYLSGGVKEYWIIDRGGRTLTVFRNRPDGVEERVVPEGENYTTEVLPGFVLPLAVLLEKADRYRKVKPRPKRPKRGAE